MTVYSAEIKKESDAMTVYNEEIKIENKEIKIENDEIKIENDEMTVAIFENLNDCKEIQVNTHANLIARVQHSARFKWGLFYAPFDQLFDII